MLIKITIFFIVFLLLKNLIMQCPMPILPQPTALNPLKDAAKIEANDYSPDFIIAQKKNMI